MRALALTAPLLLMLLVVTGCSGITPAPRTATEAALAEIEAGRTKDQKDKAILLADLRGTLLDWAADLADSEMVGKADKDGKLKLTDAKAVLATYRTRQASADKRIRELSGKTDTSANYDAARELLEGVADVLKALERRRREEDELQESTIKAAKAAAKRAKRGGI